MLIFTYTNGTGQPQKVAVEPWGALELLKPEETLTIEYENPTEMGVTVDERGVATISLLADRVRWNHSTGAWAVGFDASSPSE